MYLLCYFFILSCVSIFSATDEAQLADNKKSCLSDKLQSLHKRYHECKSFIQSRAKNYPQFNPERIDQELERIKILMLSNIRVGMKENKEFFMFNSDFFPPKQKEVFFLLSIINYEIFSFLDKETVEIIQDCMNADLYPVDTRDMEENSLLHFAAISNNFQIAQILFANGVNVQARNVYGETSLDLAVSEKNDACMETLIAHGASVKVLNEEDKRYVQSHIEAQVKRYLG